MTRIEAAQLLCASLISGFLGALLALALFGSPPVHAGKAPENVEPIVSAGELRLVDSQGKVRAHLRLTESGLPMMDFLQADGRAALSLGMEAGSAEPASAAESRSASPEARPTIVLRSDDGRVALHDSGGNQRAVVGVTTATGFLSGEKVTTPLPSITLFNAEGTVIWAAPHN